MCFALQAIWMKPLMRMNPPWEKAIPIPSGHSRLWIICTGLSVKMADLISNPDDLSFGDVETGDIGGLSEDEWDIDHQVDIL